MSISCNQSRLLIYKADIKIFQPPKPLTIVDVIQVSSLVEVLPQDPAQGALPERPGGLEAAAPLLGALQPVGLAAAAADGVDQIDDDLGHDGAVVLALVVPALVRLSLGLLGHLSGRRRGRRALFLDDCIGVEGPLSRRRSLRW